MPFDFGDGVLGALPEGDFTVGLLFASPCVTGGRILVACREIRGSVATVDSSISCPCLDGGGKIGDCMCGGAAPTFDEREAIIGSSGDLGFAG